MPIYKIRGVDVDFPFEAYDCQILYMEKVIESLQSKCNALLESPTGTGKTLCLLCATLAWRKSLGNFSTSGRGKMNETASHSDTPSSQSGASIYPTIVYTSRTHSQLRQVIQELKRSNYRPKMTMLGSREQLCIHDEVSQLRGKAQTNACHFLCRKREKRYCTHFPLVADYVKQNPFLGDEPLDIEDLANIGRKFGPCPYYLSRELLKEVDIIFAPYNYLIDRGNRKSLKLDWDNSILIFDEAHNLEGLCADASSFDLSAGLLTACISEAKNCVDLAVARRDQSNDKSQNPDDFAILRALLLKLEKRIAEVPIESKELGFTKPGPYIYELLDDLNITLETSSKLIAIIEDAAVLLEEDKIQKTKGTACRLESISDILKTIFRDRKNDHAEFYRVHVREVEANPTDFSKGKASRTLSWWCFNPGIAMQEFSKLGVGSVILTSGTLSPMDSFAQELKLDFPVRLENPHVISKNQIWAGVVPVGPSGCSLNSSYRSRDSIEYKEELGNAIVNFARIVPDGLLVFFPSYYMLDQSIGCWKNTSHGNSTTIWERICKHKKPVVEPRQASLFPLSIEDYMTKLKDKSTSGAVFFAVCRGKVSEGLDFADHAGRAVVVTGMPFATRTDPKVRLKREYLDQQAISRREELKRLNSTALLGEEWYSQQASRAVNQAVGRVIRHRHDYGAIIFCDERFLLPNLQSQVSCWIQPYMKSYSKFGDVVSTLTRFFRDGKVLNPIKLELKQSTTDQNSSATLKRLLDEQVKEPSSESIPFSLGSSSLSRGNETEKKTPQPGKKVLGEFCKVTSSPHMVFSSESVSSLAKVTRKSTLSQLRDFLPANRSSLTPLEVKKDLKLKHSSHLIRNEEKMLISGRKSMEHKNNEMIDLTVTSLRDRDQRKVELSAPCFVKKRKAIGTEQEKLQHSSCGEGSQSIHRSALSRSVKDENMKIFDDRVEEITVQESKDVQTCAVSRRDDKARGSEYLDEVRRKLSVAEYKEFVGYMKALKSKVMKTDQVLQSIFQMFSKPERLPLLKRFKDFVPAKYIPLYERYVERNNNSNKFDNQSMKKQMVE